LQLLGYFHDLVNRNESSLRLNLNNNKLSHPSKTMKKALILLALGGIIAIHSCKKDSSDDKKEETTTGTTSTVDDRQKVIDDYNNNYLTSAVSTAELAWTGNAAGCDAGTVSQLAHDRVIQRINYFRRQVGYTESITLDASKSAASQDCSLMMKANNSLNHTPPTSWSCYTAAGAGAAGNSNISLGSHSTASITGQMQDAGAGNTAAGHRRWILYSGLVTAGHGSTDGSSNLYVLHNFGNPKAASTPEFISWPPKGYVINKLVFPRWSFSIPGADLSNATITMTNDGNNTTLAKEPYANGYGDNTVVWVPQIGPSATDAIFTVTVGNVMIGGVAKSYSYEVTAINP
jgi:hypothetical protein